MSSSAAIATTIFALAMVATIVVGLLSARGRDKGLAEWSVSSRGLGVLFIWLLMAGETYTSFSFLGRPAGPSPSASRSSTWWRI